MHGKNANLLRYCVYIDYIQFHSGAWTRSDDNVRAFFFRPIRTC